MSTLNAALFGKPTFEPRIYGSGSGEPAKAQELLCYLLLNRGRVYGREALAETLWAEQPAQRARQYLRKTIWQLQAAFHGVDAPPALAIEDDDICLSDEADVWVDVADFEACCAAVRGVNGRDLSTDRAEGLRRAVALHTGELLQGWYQEWCLLERERLELLYLGALDKLVVYCESRGEIEAGVQYALDILREDQAHERSHRALMRMYYRAGDRTAALRQYERCVTALRGELDVAPAARTRDLYERMRHGPGEALEVDVAQAPAAETKRPGGPHGLLRIQRRLAAIQRQLAREIDSIENGRRR